MPQSSFVGTMFEKGEKYTVVQSSAKGLFQHDPLSWELDGPEYIKLPELSGKGKKYEEQFREGMKKMSAEEKMNLVNTLFGLVAETGAKTLTEFTEGGIKRLISLVRSYSGLDKTKREFVMTLILKLFDLKRDKVDE